MVQTSITDVSADAPAQRPISGAGPKPLRVCLTNPIGYTGAAYYDCALVNGLGAAGTDVQYISPPPDLLPWNQLCDTPVKPWFQGYMGDRGRLVKSLAFARSIRRVVDGIRSLDTDIVHYEFPLLPPLDYHMIKKLQSHRIPVALTVHDTELFHGGRIFRRFHHKIVSACDGLIVHTRYSLNRLEELFPNEDIAGKSRIIGHPHYGPTVGEGSSPRQARKRLSLPEDRPVFLFFGGMREEKGLDTLLHGFQRLVAAGEDGMLVVAGSPPKSFSFDLDRLRKLERHLGIQNRTRWDIKRIDHTEMIDYYSAASAVIVPYHRIDMSGVVLLAMTLGKPIVATRVGGFPEVIRDSENGLLVPPDDPQRLATAMIRLARNPSEGERLGAAARQTALTEFDPVTIGRQTRGFYEELIGRRS